MLLSRQIVWGQDFPSQLDILYSSDQWMANQYSIAIENLRRPQPIYC
jgi:hypothetical protein